MLVKPTAASDRDVGARSMMHEHPESDELLPVPALPAVPPVPVVPDAPPAPAPAPLVCGVRCIGVAAVRHGKAEVARIGDGSDDDRSIRSIRRILPRIIGPIRVQVLALQIPTTPASPPSRLADCRTGVHARLPWRCAHVGGRHIGAGEIRRTGDEEQRKDDGLSFIHRSLLAGGGVRRNSAFDASRGQCMSRTAPCPGTLESAGARQFPHGSARRSAPNRSGKDHVAAKEPRLRL
jgi:hypothetical protein